MTKLEKITPTDDGANQPAKQPAVQTESDAVATALATVLSGRDLEARGSEQLFSALVEGRLTQIEITALAVALKVKGECAGEIVGAARALRRAALPFDVPDYPFADTCGTGGDGSGTVNISTATAFVAAACGVPVAKHGNRSVSSRCGSLDLLEAVGARIDAAPAVARRSLDIVGVCALSAPQYHSGIGHAMPMRRTLATRTIFNLLGPLVNPAAPTWQLVGVYDPGLCRRLAEVLGQLGARSALVVHGDGLDEIAVHGATKAVLLKDGHIRELTIEPEDAGIERSPPGALKGGGPEENARWLMAILQGDGPRAHRDAVALNTGALLWLAETADNLSDGVARARSAMMSGEPYRRLLKFIEISHGA